MSIREMLSIGEFPEASTLVVDSIKARIEEYWAGYEFTDEGYELKDTRKAERLFKSNNARQQRKLMKEIKNSSKKTESKIKKVH